MCFGGRSKEDEAGETRSRELDKIIRQDEKRLAKEVKLLLLGMFTPNQSHYPVDFRGFTSSANLAVFNKVPASRASRRS